MNICILNIVWNISIYETLCIKVPNWNISNTVYGLSLQYKILKRFCQTGTELVVALIINERLRKQHTRLVKLWFLESKIARHLARCEKEPMKF